jgi:hypothetical protein
MTMTESELAELVARAISQRQLDRLEMTWKKSHPDYKDQQLEMAHIAIKVIAENDPTR